MAWTTSGTISLTNGSAIVTGSGTTWASDGVTTGGDTLLIGGVLYQVLSVQSDTQLTLAANFAGTTVTGASYALIHTGLLPSALASSLSSLQSKYLTTVSQLYTWETATSGTVPLTNPATGATTNVTPLQAFMAASAQLSGAAFTGAISAPSAVIGTILSIGSSTAEGTLQLNYGPTIGWDIQAGAGGTQNLRFYDTIGNAEVMRLTTSGLGIGTSSPSAYHMLTVAGNGNGIAFGQAGNGALMEVSSNSAIGGLLWTNHYYNGADRASVAGYSPSIQPRLDNGEIQFLVTTSVAADAVIAQTQAMTLDNSGNLLVGITAVSTTPTTGFIAIPSFDSTGASGVAIGHANGAASGTHYAAFAYNGAQIGSITQSGTTGVAYNTTSDRRLKTNLGIATISRIGDIVIHDFTWKSDGTKARGVFAQEAAQVIPEAVHVGDDGEEVTDPWQVDYSKFVPDLIVEVQALRARVAQLETLH